MNIFKGLKFGLNKLQMDWQSFSSQMLIIAKQYIGEYITIHSSFIHQRFLEYEALYLLLEEHRSYSELWLKWAEMIQVYK